MDLALLSALRKAALHPCPEDRVIIALQLIAERVEAIWPTDGVEVASWIRAAAAALHMDAVEAAEQTPAAEPGAPAPADVVAEGSQQLEPEAPAKGRRARTVKGQYRGDDPATPDVNEAYADSTSTTTD